MPRSLNLRQQKFVDEYLISFNASDAARKAGYSKATSQQISAKLLLNAVIQESLATRFQKVAVKYETKLIDTQAKAAKSLDFCERLIAACEKWLVVNGEIELDARTTEIQIIYTDPREKTALKWPKQHKGTAAELIDRLESEGTMQVESITSKIDIRKYVIDVLAETRATLAELARIQGDYTKDKANPADNVSIAKQVAQELLAQGNTKDDAIKYAAARYGILESELVL